MLVTSHHVITLIWFHLSIANDMTVYVYKFHDNKLAEDKSVWLSIN